MLNPDAFWLNPHWPIVKPDGFTPYVLSDGITEFVCRSSVTPEIRAPPSAFNDPAVTIEPCADTPDDHNALTIAVDDDVIRLNVPIELDTFDTTPLDVTAFASNVPVSETLLRTVVWSEIAPAMV